MIRTDAGTPRGILRLNGVDDERIRYSRRLPAVELQFFIEHYWLIDWDLSMHEPERVETLPHPSVHFVFEKGKSAIVGVVRGKFTRSLEGKGRIFGVKFRPGAFYAFAKTPVARFTDRTVDVAQVFGEAGRVLEPVLVSQDEEQLRVSRADRFFQQRLPAEDDTVALVNRIVSRVIADREIRKVEHLVRAFDVNLRRLQRIFHQYVGITPKWMIQRYRLHEAIERIARRRTIDWARLALELGYCDQAHFIKDFRAIVHCSPGEYRRTLRRRASP